MRNTENLEPARLVNPWAMRLIVDAQEPNPKLPRMTAKEANAIIEAARRSSKSLQDALLSKLTERLVSQYFAQWMIDQFSKWRGWLKILEAWERIEQIRVDEDRAAALTARHGAGGTQEAARGSG